MEIEIGQLIRAIRRLWWIPVVLGLVLGLLGFGSTRFLGETTYTATTQMLVTAQISGDPILSEGSRTETYIALVTSGPVLDRVILELDLEYTREDLVDDVVDAHIVSGTQIIAISVTTTNAGLSADIANSLANNFVVTATDLSIGELQRNLDEIRGQSTTIRDRITVIDTRLAEIDTEENAADSEVQAEISQLERERLEASQTLADLDRTSRELTTSLSTTSIPVVVTDFAKAPEAGDSAISPVLLALLGVFLGGLIGAAVILWCAFTDKVLRSPDQLVTQPVLARIKGSDLVSDDSGKVAHLAAKLAGIREATGSDFIFASTKDTNVAEELRAALKRRDSGNLTDLLAAEAVLQDASSMRTASQATSAIVVAESGKSRIDDLQELVQILAAMNTNVVGTILVD